MNADDFALQLKAEGFQEIETRTLEPRPANHEHAHDSTVKGLVTAGQFIVTCDGNARTYTAGEIFEVVAGVNHSEAVGSEGATITVGRLYPNS